MSTNLLVDNNSTNSSPTGDGNTRTKDSTPQTMAVSDGVSSDPQSNVQPDLWTNPMMKLQLPQTTQTPAQCRKVVKVVLSTKGEPCLPESLDTLLLTPTWSQEGVMIMDHVLSYKSKQAVSTPVENQICILFG